MAEHRMHALEQKARTKYMRMKNSNDNETVRLKHEWERMDRAALHSLEGFLKDSNEVSGLQKTCLRNSGWYGEAIRPKSREVNKLQRVMSATQSTKWNYFAGGNIELWEKHPQTILRQSKASARPQTAHARVLERPRDNNVIMTSPNDVTTNVKVRPVTAIGGATVKDREMLAKSIARSKSAKAPRFRSPRLESDLKAAKKKSKRSLRNALAPTELHTSYEVVPNDNVRTHISQEDPELDDVFDGIAPSVPMKTTMNSTINSQIQRGTSSQNASGSNLKSVSFKHQESVASLQRSPSLLSKSKPSKSSFVFDTSDDDEEPGKQKQKPATALSPRLELRMPKFYVRPQDRHRSEDMFLMRRHALLQRQIANGVPSERVTKHSKLRINATFSSVARQDYLKSLIDGNMDKTCEDKKVEYKHNMQEKVDHFLNSIDQYLGKDSKVVK